VGWCPRLGEIRLALTLASGHFLQVRVVRRDTGEKFDHPVERVGDAVSSLLEEVQQDMLARARRERDAAIR